MPTGGDSGEYYTLAQKYGSDATNTNSLQYNLSTPLSGYYFYSSADDQGSNGYWWSPTYGGSDGMYFLGVGPTYVDPDPSSYRDHGQSMRCLLSE